MARVQKWTLEAKTTTSGSSAGAVTIYGRLENWNYFFDTVADDQLSECKAAVVKTSVTPKDHKRRSNALDTTGTNVIPTTGRRYLTGITRTSGNALPGKTLIVSEVGESVDDEVEQRAFQYVGTWTDLYLHMEDSNRMDIYAYNESGAKYLICETVGAPTQAGAQSTDLVRAR